MVAKTTELSNLGDKSYHIQLYIVHRAIYKIELIPIVGIGYECIYEVITATIYWTNVETIRTFLVCHYVYESIFLPLLRRFNPAEPVVAKSVILQRIKMSRAFPHMLSNRSAKGL